MIQTGELTVSGKSSTHILLAKYPHDVVVRFASAGPIVPCNPHYHEHDRLSYQIEEVDEDPRHHREPGHHHHDRQFYLVIRWEVSGVREIYWHVHY